LKKQYAKGYDDSVPKTGGLSRYVGLVLPDWSKYFVSNTGSKQKLMKGGWSIIDAGTLNLYDIVPYDRSLQEYVDSDPRWKAYCFDTASELMEWLTNGEDLPD
jgi:hypothetical protein